MGVGEEVKGSRGKVEGVLRGWEERRGAERGIGGEERGIGGKGDRRRG